MKKVKINPHLKHLTIDHLYHLGLDTGMDLKKMFGDVRFVCMGGSADRARAFAEQLVKEFDGSSRDLKPIGKTERYTLYKVGPVISAAHGIGMPSLSVFMHEITKLLHYAACVNPVLLRIGTSGGIGLEPGTVVVTEEALNAGLEGFYELFILGERKRFSARFNHGINAQIMLANKSLRVVSGKTVAANCFYEEQTRLDGALDPGYTEIDKMVFLKRAYDLGVRNFEMESLQFGAFCNRAGLEGAVICVTLVDRLKGDQITATPEALSRYSERAQQAAINFIRTRLAL